MGSDNLFAMFMRIRNPYATAFRVLLSTALAVNSESVEPAARQNARILRVRPHPG